MHRVFSINCSTRRRTAPLSPSIPIVVDNRQDSQSTCQVQHSSWYRSRMTNFSDEMRKMLDSLTPSEMEILRRRFPSVLDAYDLQEAPTKEDDQNVEK